MRWQISVVLGALVLVVPGAATAQEPPPTTIAVPEAETAEIVARKRNVIAIQGSYGASVEINGSVLSNVSSLWVRWTRRTGTSFAAGEPAWGFELVPLVRVSQDPTAYGAGGHFVFEHRFVPEAQIRPVFRAGAGMVFTNNEVPVGETRYNFSLFAGAGLEIGVARNTWLSLDYRLQHLSNADTGNRNPGINAHAFGFGLGWRF